QNIINKIKTYTDIPIGVGFGIKDSEQVKNISQFSDAVVVGSAIVQKINNLKEQNLNDQDLVSSLTNYLLDLSSGLNT
ncbi:MAG: tryptophan synthase subunit alpha, partial [Alphaproteobacteria bacterium]|nr:tryptophan synthase subunit alpha [Alphaproteobacteria bacterium]